MFFVLFCYLFIYLNSCMQGAARDWKLVGLLASKGADLASWNQAQKTQIGSEGDLRRLVPAVKVLQATDLLRAVMWASSKDPREQVGARVCVYWKHWKSRVMIEMENKDMHTHRVIKASRKCKSLFSVCYLERQNCEQEIGCHSLILLYSNNCRLLITSV